MLAFLALPSEVPPAKQEGYEDMVRKDKAKLALEGHELTVTHLRKVYWPKEGYTKGDLLRYYLEAAPYLLPYLNDRPQSLHRFPEGIPGGYEVADGIFWGGDFEAAIEMIRAGNIDVGQFRVTRA